MFEGMAPMKRMAQLDEISGLVAYLASDEAGFISGRGDCHRRGHDSRDDGRMSDLGAKRWKAGSVYIWRATRDWSGLRGTVSAEGAEVVLSDLDADDSETATTTLARLGQAASYICANVTREEDWERAAATVQERHGALHVLVNNAGTDLTGPVETLSLESWRRIMAVNVDGVFLGTKHFVPLLAASGAGVKGGSSIINVSSIMGLVGLSEVSAYNASKGAVRLFTKGIALEFACQEDADPRQFAAPRLRAHPAAQLPGSSAGWIRAQRKGG